MCAYTEIEAPHEPLQKILSPVPTCEGVSAGHIIMSSCFGNRHYVSSEEIRVLVVGLQLLDSAMRLSTHGAQEKHCKCRVKSEK